MDKNEKAKQVAKNALSFHTGKGNREFAEVWVTILQALEEKSRKITCAECKWCCKRVAHYRCSKLSIFLEDLDFECMYAEKRGF